MRADSVPASHLSLPRWRLAQLGSHLVVALIALVVVGGATRVMEAGLACPDWPLCFGSFLPGKQMNLQVFLEWFHRLDAFLIGIALLILLVFSWIWRDHLPKPVPIISALLVLLVAVQGILGALTVTQLLQGDIVTAHLAIALTLVAIMSGLTQSLLSPNRLTSPLWWRLMGGISLSAVMVQCLIGGRMATSWASHKCLSLGQNCFWLDLHRNTAKPIACIIMLFLISSLLSNAWPKSQWQSLFAISGLLSIQIILGVLSTNFELAKPSLTIAHQLIAALLIAFLSAMCFKSPPSSSSTELTEIPTYLLETSHG